MTAEVKTAVEIALLQQGQEYIKLQVTTLAAEMKTSNASLNDKFDKVLTELMDQKAKSRLRATTWAFTRHIATVVVTLYLGWRFKIPLDASGG